MTQEQIIQKPSKATNLAIISAVFILIYEILFSFVSISLIVTGSLNCNRQDYGACALQNMFVDSLGFVVTLLFGLVIPICLILANGIFIIVGWRQNDGAKKLLVASMALDFLAFAVLFVYAILAMLFSGR